VIGTSKFQADDLSKADFHTEEAKVAQ